MAEDFAQRDECEIEVPLEFNTHAYLARFRERYADQFVLLDQALTDEHFQNATHMFQGGERYLVKLFEQVYRGGTSGKRRIQFIHALGAIFPNAQGAALLWEHRRDILPQDKSCSFLDQERSLWEHPGGLRMVPVLVRGRRIASFHLTPLDSTWCGEGFLAAFFLLK